MKTVIEEAYKELTNGREFAIATVVKTRGSVPQKPGAKLLIKTDGSGIGTLGGGCVEGDIWFAAKEILRRKQGPTYKKYILNEDVAARDGLVCGGTMHFLIEPIFETQKFQPFIEEILLANQGVMPITIGTVTKSNIPKQIGTKFLIRANGTTKGTFPNKTIKNKLIELGSTIAKKGNNIHFAINKDIEVFLEGFTTTPTMIIMGGGHVGQAVANLANILKFDITIIDDRTEFTNPERFPKNTKTILSDFSSAFKNLPVNFNSYILIATRGHKFDDMALHAAIKTDARYIGMLGSKRKTLMIYRNLLKQQIEIDKIYKIQGPVGLDIGAITPEELAVSIMSEIIMIQKEATGKSLSMDKNYLKKLLLR